MTAATVSLSNVIEGFGEDVRPSLTVGEMLAAFDSRAFGAMLFIFGALNTLPLPPGSSTILSLPILLLAPQIALGADAPWLPRRMVEKPLRRDDLRGLFRKLTPVVKRMELVTRPRLTWMFANGGERMIGVVCTLLAMVLVLPIPLGNLAPGATVAVLALALLQRDGLLALLGYLMAAVSAGLLFLSAGVVVAAVRKMIGVVSGLFLPSTAPLDTSLRQARCNHMQVQVSGKHVDVGEALRSRVSDEIALSIGKYFDRGGDADVVISKEGHAFRADCSVKLASGQQLISHGAGGDAHAAFDAALAKIETRIRRYKRRLKSHSIAATAKQAENAAMYVLRAPDVDDHEDDDWGVEDAHPAGAPAAMIIAETQASLKVMTVSMAVMELDLTESQAIVFRNAAHDGLSVVYRRSDGNIGWIDPERTKSLNGHGSTAG